MWQLNTPLCGCPHHSGVVSRYFLLKLFRRSCWLQAVLYGHSVNWIKEASQLKNNLSGKKIVIFQFTLVVHSDHAKVWGNYLNWCKAELCSSGFAAVVVKHCFTIAVLSHSASTVPVLEDIWVKDPYRKFSTRRVFLMKMLQLVYDPFMPPKCFQGSQNWASESQPLHGFN